jgi:tetratricopeptide (TPR) repeat protein
LADLLVKLAEKGREYWPQGRDGEDKELYAEARKHYQNAIDIDPKYALAHNGLANLLMKVADKGRYWPERKDDEDKELYAEARKHYQDAIDIDPKYHSPHSGLANLLMELADKGREYWPPGRDDRSLYAEAKDVSNWFAQYPDVNAGHSVISAYLELVTDNYDHGCEELDRALALLDKLPVPIEAHVKAWFFLYSLGAEDRRDDALTRLRRFIVQDGVRSPWWNFTRIIELASRDGHPEAAWLPKLAAVIAEGVAPSTLDDWPAWQKAG